MKSFTTSFVILCSLAGSAQHGTLDVTFSGNGIQITDISNTEIYHAVVQLSDGRLLGIGTSGGVGTHVTLVCYTEDGSVDSTFGTDGVVITDFSDSISLSSSGQDAVVQPDGKIVVVGYASDGPTSDCVLARYHADGSLDNTFGTDGKVRLDLSSPADGLYEVALQVDGKIVACGQFNGIDPDILVARFNSDGTLDNSFSGDGYVTVDPAGAGSDRANDVGVQDDGKIVVGGSAMTVNSDFVLVRFEPDGTIDSSFGTNGITMSDLMGGDDYGNAMVIQHDGKIALTGNGSDGSTQIFAMMRYLADGSIDAGFGLGGLDTFSGWKYAESWAIIQQPDDKLLQAGGGYTDSTNNFVLVRYLADGSRDASFGMNGIVTTDLANTSDEYAYDALLQEDGKIVLAGQTQGGLGEGVDYDLAVTRYLSGLQLGIVDFEPETSSVLVYPNPINDVAILEYELIQDDCITISLSDLHGRLMETLLFEQHRAAGPHQEPLRLGSTLAAGNYMLSVSNGRGNVSIMIVKTAAGHP